MLEVPVLQAILFDNANLIPIPSRAMSTQVYAVFAETLGIPLEGITDATAPENTPEWDSLKAMDLVVALEGAFDVRFSTKEIISMRNIGIVRKVLVAKGIQDA